MRSTGRKLAGMAIILLAVIVVLGGGWLFLRQRNAGHRTLLSAFTEREVDVKLYLEEDSAHAAWLVGVFTPARKGFHLYSKNLPRDGLNGLGRPTLLEIVSADTVTAAGPLVADK